MSARDLIRLLKKIPPDSKIGWQDHDTAEGQVASRINDLTEFKPLGILSDCEPIDYKSRAEALERSDYLLKELLAAIHCDGGHYVAEHGIEKAVHDAFKIRSDLVVKVEALEALVEWVKKHGDQARFRLMWAEEKSLADVEALESLQNIRAIIGKEK